MNTNEVSELMVAFSVDFSVALAAHYWKKNTYFEKIRILKINNRSFKHIKKEHNLKTIFSAICCTKIHHIKRNVYSKMKDNARLDEEIISNTDTVE